MQTHFLSYYPLKMKQLMYMMVHFYQLMNIIRIITTFQRKMEKFKAHLQIVKIVSGVFLVFIGLLIFLGSLTKLNVFFFTLASNLEIWSTNNIMGSRLLFGFPFLFLSSLLVFFYVRKAHRSITLSGMVVSNFLFPIRLIIIMVSAGITILSFTGIMEVNKLIVLWLRFQGI